jgi:dienelactone hydrolase
MTKTLVFLAALFYSTYNLMAQQKNDVTHLTPTLSYEYIGSYSIDRLNKIANEEANEFSKYKVTFGKATNAVKLYRLTYASVIPEKNNKPTMASGLIAIPENAKGKVPVLSYQHGTTFIKTDVPSFPDQAIEIRLMLASFAANGYVVISADNFGKGTSTEPDAYMAIASTQQASLDMLFASQAVLKSMNLEQNQLFLGGWSMGSWGTMQFIQKLQSLEIPVTAAFVCANPTDIFAAINAWMHESDKSLNAIWLNMILALQIHSYSVYYDMPELPKMAIKEKYQQAADDYANFKIDFETFIQRTTTSVTEFLKPEFIASGVKGEGKYWSLIKQANPLFYVNNTPLQSYYGEADEAVPLTTNNTMEAYQKLVGGVAIESINAGKTADHAATYKFAIPNAKVWFDSLLKK